MNFGAGIMLRKKVGHRLVAGDVIARLYASDAGRLAEGKKMFDSALAVGIRPPRKQKLIREIIGPDAGKSKIRQ